MQGLREKSSCRVFTMWWALFWFWPGFFVNPLLVFVFINVYICMWLYFVLKDNCIMNSFAKNRNIKILPDYVLHLSFFYSWLQERGYIDLCLVGQRNGLEETGLSLKLQPIRIQQLCKSVFTRIIWIELTTICIISLLWFRVYNNQWWSRIWDGTNPPESSHSSQKQGLPSCWWKKMWTWEWYCLIFHYWPSLIIFLHHSAY